MVKKTKAKGELKGRARLRSEIVEMTQGLHRLGMVSDGELEQTTLRMLAHDALPKVAALSPAEIVKLRRRAGVSQAVMARFLNVAVGTISQWERGEKHPRGASLKLLTLVAKKGLHAVA